MKYLIIGIVIMFVLGVLRLYAEFKGNHVDEEKLSARDYWRWKHGGID